MLLNLEMKSSDLYNKIGGRTSFIGQYPEIYVIIVKLFEPEKNLAINKHVLPEPFDTQSVQGPIVLIKIDEESEPQDFTIFEWNAYQKKSL